MNGGKQNVKNRTFPRVAWEFVQIAAFFTVAATVVVVFLSMIVVSAETKMSTLLNGRVKVAETATECARDDTAQVGALSSFTCATTPTLRGPLSGVTGQALSIEAAITALEDAQGSEPVAYTCKKWSDDSLSCVLGELSLNDHLARHGFAAPSPDPAVDRRAVQGWLATLLGFTGAAVAFYMTNRKEESSGLRKRENLKTRVAQLFSEFKETLSTVTQAGSNYKATDYEDLTKRMLKTNNDLIEEGIDTRTLTEIVRSFKNGEAHADHIAQINRLSMAYREALDA